MLGAGGAHSTNLSDHEWVNGNAVGPFVRILSDAPARLSATRAPTSEVSDAFHSSTCGAPACRQHRVRCRTADRDTTRIPGRRLVQACRSQLARDRPVRRQGRLHRHNRARVGEQASQRGVGCSCVGRRTAAIHIAEHGEQFPPLVARWSLSVLHVLAKRRKGNYLGDSDGSAERRSDATGWISYRFHAERSSICCMGRRGFRARGRLGQDEG